MNTKALAHRIQLGLSEAAGLDVKRSQIHELIAAALGHGSQAAMLTAGIACPMPQPLAKYQALDKARLSKRALDLGIHTAVPGTLADAVISAMDGAGMRFLPLDLVVRLLMEGRFELYADELMAHLDSSSKNAARVIEEDYFDSDAWEQRQEEEMSAVLHLSSDEVISALNAAIDRSDARAHLCLAILLSGDPDDIAEQDGAVGGKYWFEQEQKGRVLAGVEKEWAAGYQRETEIRQKVREHLDRAANLGQPDALLLLAQHYRDPRFFGLNRPLVHADPMAVASLAHDMGFPQAAQVWMEMAAESGDITAMRTLVKHIQQGDPLKCWTWYHLALMHGKDLTQSDYRAIHEDGSAYEDDVGGPMYLDGEDAIDLPGADEATQLSAQKLAQALFSK